MEDRRGKDDKVSGRMWKAVETEARKIGVAKAKRGRSKRGSRKEKRRKSREKTENVEEEKDDRSKEGSRGVGNLG